MTTPEPDVDSFITALRSNLPTRRDDQRIRARLAAAGVVSLGVAAPAAAAASAGTGLGLVSKVLGASFIAKIGVLTVVAGVAAVPAALELGGPAETEAFVTPEQHGRAQLVAGPFNEPQLVVV